MTKFKVGVFLAFGLVVLIVSVFMLGANKSIFQNSYKISTYFDSVQGLNSGAIVSLAGVKIGNIETIEYNEAKNLVEVIFLMDADYAKLIKSDSVVEIRTQGALGDKFLYITPGIQGTPITNGSELKAEFGNDLISVISKRGSESENLFNAINNLNKIVQALAEQNKLTSVVSKLDIAAGNLIESTEKINKALAQDRLEKSMVKMNSILDKIDHGHGTLGALINDRSIHERIKSILGAGQKEQQVKSIIRSSVEE